MGHWCIRIVAWVLLLFVFSSLANAQIDYESGRDTFFSHSDGSVFGGDIRGGLWRRPEDKFGVAFAADGLSRDHREYLALGGLGFLLGDGRLRYGPEEVCETYYNFPIPLHRGLFAALDIQYVNNPGYNRDRGPVTVLGARIHVEL